jgi:hypothetical protein
MSRRSIAVLALLCAGVAGTPGCSEDVLVGSDTAGGAGTGGTSAGMAGESSGTCEPASCQGRTYRCGDCIDNDGDGAVDAFDLDCLGPCDDAEDAFGAGLPDAMGASCRVDCYFDRNAGVGNDQCQHSQRCDPLSVGPTYPPSGLSACAYDESASIPGTSASCAELRSAQPGTCLDLCLPLTPNGCDCFGCCELPARTGHFVWVGSSNAGQSTCTAERLDDATACRPCTPVPSCFNPCDACEVCAGDTELAADCGEVRCDPGRSPCAQVSPPCAPGFYCITGCCVAEPR